MAEARPGRAIVLMGVTGVGKSTVGRLLADRLGCRFLEGDAYHPPENLAKMRAGIPLEDADRWPWLEALRGELARVLEAGESVVLACSALKRADRDRREPLHPRQDGQHAEREECREDARTDHDCAFTAHSREPDHDHATGNDARTADEREDVPPAPRVGQELVFELADPFAEAQGHVGAEGGDEGEGCLHAPHAPDVEHQRVGIEHRELFAQPLAAGAGLTALINDGAGG